MVHVHALVSRDLDLDVLLADVSLSPQQRHDIVVLAICQIQYEAERRMRRSGPQKRAMGLLRSFLSPEQQRQLSCAKSFFVRGSAGGLYRLIPRTGNVELVEKHGKRWYVRDSYCLHDDEKAAADGRRLPPADLSLQHMLWLVAGEETFLATANASSRRDIFWNGDWARELREAARERDAVRERVA